MLLVLVLMIAAVVKLEKGSLGQFRVTTEPVLLAQQRRSRWLLVLQQLKHSVFQQKAGIEGARKRLVLQH